MDIALEKQIINAFFYRNFRDRMLHELSKDRGRFIHKICQAYDKYMLPECFWNRSNKFPSPEALLYEMKSHGARDMCYVISMDSDIDGKYVELMKAIEQLASNGLASFIVGLPSGFTHFKAESILSQQPNCFLKPKVRFDRIEWEG